ILYGPYFLIDPLLFKKGYDYYSQSSIGEWTIQSWQDANQRYPYHMNNGLGFAHYIYEFVTGTLADKIAFYKNVHLYLCIITTSILGLYSWKYRTHYDFSVLAISTLKLYLSVFYSFVLIPYSYLYVLPNMFSFVVLLVLINLTW